MEAQALCTCCDARVCCMAASTRRAAPTRASPAAPPRCGAGPLPLLGGARLLHGGIPPPRRADQRLPRRLGGLRVPRRADELLVQRGVVREGREREPQLHVTF